MQKSFSSDLSRRTRKKRIAYSAACAYRFTLIVTTDYSCRSRAVRSSIPSNPTARIILADDPRHRVLYSCLRCPFLRAPRRSAPRGRSLSPLRARSCIYTTEVDSAIWTLFSRLRADPEEANGASNNDMFTHSDSISRWYRDGSRMSRRDRLRYDEKRCSCGRQFASEPLL